MTDRQTTLQGNMQNCLVKLMIALLEFSSSERISKIS